MSTCDHLCDSSELTMHAPPHIPATREPQAFEYTILVVDDSATDRRLVGGLLREIRQVQVVFATNGREAIEYVSEHHPDLVITDLLMPEMDGMELLSYMAKQFPLIPVVLMTSTGNEEIASQAVSSGARGYVPKTALARVLPGTVDRLLALAKQLSEHSRLLDSIVACQLTITIRDNDTALISHLVEYASACLKNSGLCREGGENLVGLALEEALQNAILHGNLELGSALREVCQAGEFQELVQQRRDTAPYRDRIVQVELSITSREARFVVRDEGSGFDPSLVPDPTTPDQLERLCGRGLLLMRSLMDEVRFNDRGNEVTLIKRARH